MLQSEITTYSDNFVVDDQMLMNLAGRYNKWLYSLVSSYLEGAVLEVGSGIGNISQYILNTPGNVKALTCVDIDPDCCKSLRMRVKRMLAEIKVNIVNSDFMDMSSTEKYDCIFNFNLLEHIEKDTEALKKMEELLVDGGKIMVFVPAGKALYGSMDRMLKHFRRYSLDELYSKFNSCGMKVINMRYYNMIGFFGWFVNNRIFKIRNQKKSQIRFFNNYVMPIQSKLESKIKIPFGQNLLCVARKDYEK